MPTMSPDLISGLVAFLLTIFVLSYLISDQVLFRVAIYIFVGVSAGYVAVVVWHHVLVPKLFKPVLFGTAGGDRILTGILLFFAILLFAKAIPRISKVGTPSVAILVGVGAAVALIGALTGTIFPQTEAAIQLFDLKMVNSDDIPIEWQILESGFMLLGTIGTLAYFQFTARPKDDGEYRRNILTRSLSFVGKIFVAVTFGFLFAGVYSAALTALIERLDFLIRFFVENLWLL